MHKHILIVDDDPGVRSLLGQYMRDNGFVTTEVADASEARSALSTFVFDLIILDVMLPNESGIDFAKSLKDIPSSMAILMLTAMEDAKSRILGLEAGADDYLTKPFEPAELLLRINKLIKRVRDVRAKNNMISFGSIQYDIQRNILLKNGAAVVLTSQEKKLLALLLQGNGSVISRSSLAQMLSVHERSIDVRIRRLRQKIETNPEAPLLLQTVRGSGYVLHSYV